MMKVAVIASVLMLVLVLTEGKSRGKPDRAGLRKTASDKLAEADANKDGKVSVEELRAVLATVQKKNGETVSAQKIDKMLKKIDENADGFITAEELSPPEPSGQKAAERKAARKEAAENKVAERKAARQEAAGKTSAERKAARKEAAEKRAAERKAAGKEAAGKMSAGRKAARKEAAEKKAAERKAAGQEAAGKTSAERKAARKAAKKDRKEAFVEFIKKSFQEVVANGQEEVTIAAMTAHLADAEYEGGKMPKAGIIVKLLNRLDTNNDGNITLAELAPPESSDAKKPADDSN